MHVYTLNHDNLHSWYMTFAVYMTLQHGIFLSKFLTFTLKTLVSKNFNLFVEKQTTEKDDRCL